MKIKDNIEKLNHRIQQALQSSASSELKKIVKDLKGNVLMIGTGGSYPAAQFCSNIINSENPNVKATAAYPRDIFVTNPENLDAVFLFTYSGKTHDIKLVYQYFKEKDIPVYIITMMDKKDLSNPFPKENIISYFVNDEDFEEHGFLSFAGTFIPILVFLNVYTDENLKEYLDYCFNSWLWMLNGIKFNFSRTKRNLIIDVITGEDFECSALDLESKFIESGLGRVTIHDFKDFSHGRFNIVNAFPSDITLILKNDDESLYIDKVRKFIKSQTKQSPIVFETGYKGLLGDLDLMIANNILLNYLSEYLNYDMAAPDYPEKAMELYKFDGECIL